MRSGRGNREPAPDSRGQKRERRVIWVQYAFIGLGVGSVFALLAAGIVLVYRASGVLNFAHASFAICAAYLNFELLERVSWLPVWLALIAAVALGAGLAVVSQ